LLKQDILRTYNAVNGNRLRKIVGCYRRPGVHAVIVLRFGQYLKTAPVIVRLFLEPLYLLLSHRMRSKWGINIPRSVEVGPGLYIGHSGGIVIAGDAKLGSSINLSHDVTIGVSGQGSQRGIPIIGDDVYIAPGAKIFGKISIGNNVKIGANAVIHKDIPDNSVVVLDPGFKIISTKGNVPIVEHVE